MDYEKEIQQLKEKIAFYEQFFHEMSAPIIPSIVENTILVPVAGYLTQIVLNRFVLEFLTIWENIGK